MAGNWTKGKHKEVKARFDFFSIKTYVLVKTNSLEPSRFYIVLLKI